MRTKQGGPAQIVHRVELVRHGESASNKRLMDDGSVSVDPDPPLTDLGHEQAQDIARFYKRMLDSEGARAPGGWASEDEPFVSFEVSALTRAIETAAPTLKVFAGLPGTVSVEAELRERWRSEGTWIPRREIAPDGSVTVTDVRWRYPAESYGEFRTRVAQKVSDWKRQGTPERRAHTIVFGHSNFINTALTHLIPVASHEEEAPQFFHLTNGSITVIDFDTEGDMHVHCPGFFGHLRHPTGHHTAHIDAFVAGDTGTADSDPVSTSSN